MFYIEIDIGGGKTRFLANNDETYAECMIGPGGYPVRFWATRAEAERYATRRWGEREGVRIVEANLLVTHKYGALT